MAHGTMALMEGLEEGLEGCGNVFVGYRYLVSHITLEHVTHLIFCPNVSDNTIAFTMEGF